MFLMLINTQAVPNTVLPILRMNPLEERNSKIHIL